MAEKNRPLKEFRSETSFGLKVTAWPMKNQKSQADCQYTISKRYKDKESGEWKDSRYLFKQDIQSLFFLLHQVNAWIQAQGGDVTPHEPDDETF